MKKCILLILSIILIFTLVGCQKENTSGSNQDSSLNSQNQSPKLTMEKLKELSQKGENLSWQDFSSFTSKDIGSGLHILKYDINNDYYLLISGGNITEKPMYIRLVKTSEEGKYIDIRTESIADFIK